MSKKGKDKGFSRRNFLKKGAQGLGVLGFLGTVGDFGFAASAFENNFVLVNHAVLNSQHVDSPGIASDSQGSSWTVYLRRLSEGGQQIVVGHFGEGEIPKPVFTSEVGSFESPVVCCGEGQLAMAVWSEERGDKWILSGMELKDGRAGEAECVVAGPGRAANPRLAAGKGGDYWLVWESYEKGAFSICLKRYHNKKWGKVIRVTNGKANAYEPTAVVDSDGKVWLAYSKAEGFDHNIKLCSYDPAKGVMGEVIDVAIGGKAKRKPNLNAHPDVGLDYEGRLWIAWERRTGGRACWYAGRECVVVCYSDGDIKEVAGQSKAVFRGSNDHLPTFTKDGMGRLWLFTRRGPEGNVWIDGRSKRYRIRKWAIRASRLGSEGWSEPLTLFEDTPSMIGRDHRPAMAAEGDDFFSLLWESDNFPSVLPEKYQYTLHYARLHLPPEKLEKSSFSLKKTNTQYHVSSNLRMDPAYKAQNIGRQRGRRRKITRDGQEYTLLFGNLHEHTNLSQCSLGDGSIDEEYHYGIDIEGYDFIGLTDHGYNLDRERWEKNLRAMRFYNDNPYFVAMPAFEWTASREERGGLPVRGSGHRNVIFASSNDAAGFVDDEQDMVYHCEAPQSDAIYKVWDILKKKGLRAVTIPHHPADPHHPVSWEDQDEDIETVVEMYQSRGSYEYRDCPLQYRPGNIMRQDGHFVQDALGRGIRLGFIASGDHNSMGLGASAVWVKQVSQEGIFEALKARRCYGTSGDKLLIDFRINGHLMGEEFSTRYKPHIEAEIRAEVPIKEIIIFKGNKVIYKVGAEELPDKKKAHIELMDENFGRSSYYYVRVVQENEQVGWGSPIWVNRV
jgi:hypothetical protein